MGTLFGVPPGRLGQFGQDASLSQWYEAAGEFVDGPTCDLEQAADYWFDVLRTHPLLSQALCGEIPGPNDPDNGDPYIAVVGVASTARLADALEHVPETELRAFATRISDAPCDLWAIHALRGFYRAMARAGNGVLILLN